MTRSFIAALAITGCASCAVPPAPELPLLAEPPAPSAPAAPIVATPRRDLIARSILFGAPERIDVQLSPDGKQLAWRAHGALLVAPLETGDAGEILQLDRAKQVADHVARYAWAGTQLVFDDDAGALFADAKKLADKAELLAVARRGNAVVVSIDHAIERVELASGAKTLLDANRDGFTRFWFDDALHPAFAEKPAGDGGVQWFAPKGRGWALFDTIGVAEIAATTALEVSPDGHIAYAFDSRGRDTAALVAIDLRSKARSELATNVFADATSTVVDPATRVPIAASFSYVLERWTALDFAYEADIDGIASLVGGDDYHVVSQSADNKVWIVRATSPQHPARYFAWDRAKHRGALLFSGTPQLDQAPLVPMHTVNVPTRDGLPMIGYLSLPHAVDVSESGRASAPVPLVLLVHDGPWSRDRWGYVALHQLLANRGYAVLSVNYRGSTGFGKKLTAAGDGQWGKQMQDDLLDAVGWAIVQGIARPERVAIMGLGYGGYATVMGLELTPERFACGVELDGVLDVAMLRSTLPAQLAARIGDAPSPLQHAAAIVRPLLAGRVGDDRAGDGAVAQLVAGLQARKRAVTRAAAPSIEALMPAVEPFLANCLGGSYEAAQ